MNIKRTIGTVLTLLGIVGLIYAGATIMGHSEGKATNVTVVGIIALLFFFSGISLVRTIKDEA
jgi:uncharacterized membrane protein